VCKSFSLTITCASANNHSGSRSDLRLISFDDCNYVIAIVQCMHIRVVYRNIATCLDLEFNISRASVCVISLS
jgi:hypothetical protein